MGNETALQAVIFDLDGVLVDTSIYHAKAWADLVRGVGVEPPADLEEQVKGVSRMASLKIALGSAAADYSEDELVALASRKNDCYLAAIQAVTPADLYPGTASLFRDLKAHGVAIVLGSASKNARPVMEKLGIMHWFDGIADGFAYQHGKPHPDVFLTGAAMVGAAPENCVVVEDATAGINAALDGGFVTVGMGTEASLKHAHCFVDSLASLSVERLEALVRRCTAARWRVPLAQVDGAGVWPESALGRVTEAGKEWNPGWSLTFDGSPVSVSLEPDKCWADMHNGMMTRMFAGADADGRRSQITTRCFADQVACGRAFMRVEIEVLDASGPIVFMLHRQKGASSMILQRPAIHLPADCEEDGIDIGLTAPDPLGMTFTGQNLAEGASATVATQAVAGRIVYLGVCACQGRRQGAFVNCLAESFDQARIATGAWWRAHWQGVEPEQAKKQWLPV